MSNGQTKTGDPGIFALSLFGMALIGLAITLLLGPKTAGQYMGGSVFAVLIAGIGEGIGALWYLVRGQSYLAGVLGTFGIWLVGLFLFLTSTPSQHLLTPKGVGLYALLLIVPTLYLTLPPLRARMMIFTVAFVALLLLEVFFGLENILANATLARVAGVCAVVAGLSIWTTAFQLTVHAEALGEHTDAPSAVAAK